MSSNQYDLLKKAIKTARERLKKADTPNEWDNPKYWIDLFGEKLRELKEVDGTKGDTRAAQALIDSKQSDARETITKRLYQAVEGRHFLPDAVYEWLLQQSLPTNIKNPLLRYLPARIALQHVDQIAKDPKELENLADSNFSMTPDLANAILDRTSYDSGAARNIVAFHATQINPKHRDGLMRVLVSHGTGIQFADLLQASFAAYPPFWTEDGLREFAKNPENLKGYHTLDSLVKHVNTPNDVLHQLAQSYEPGIEGKAKSRLIARGEVDSLPAVHTKFGTGKLRQFRDFLQSLGGAQKASPADIKQAGLSSLVESLKLNHLKDAKGFISAQAVQDHIEKLPAKKYTYMLGNYGNDNPDPESEDDDAVFQKAYEHFQAANEDFVDNYIDRAIDEGFRYWEAPEQEEGESEEAYEARKDTAREEEEDHIRENARSEAESELESMWENESSDYMSSAREIDPDEIYEDMKKEQRHSHKASQVFQLGTSAETIDQIRKAGLWDVFKKMQDFTYFGAHPNIKGIGLGWIRYTGGPRDEDHPDGIHIDEVQSDFGGGLDEAIREKKKDNEISAAGGTLKVPESRYAVWHREVPIEHLTKLREILYGNKHPSEILHESFLQYLRDKGQAGLPIHIWRALPKAERSQMRVQPEEFSLAAALAHFGVEDPWRRYTPSTSEAMRADRWIKKHGVKSRDEAIRLFKQQYPKHPSFQKDIQAFDEESKKEGGDPMGIARQMRISIPAQLPAHMMEEYEKIPQKMGYEPGKYGELDTQSNPRSAGEPTWKDTLRKAARKRYLSSLKKSVSEVKLSRHHLEKPWMGQNEDLIDGVIFNKEIEKLESPSAAPRKHPYVAGRSQNDYHVVLKPALDFEKDGTWEPTEFKRPENQHFLSQKFTTAHREATYSRLAHEFFGLGQYVPRATVFRDPGTKTAYSAAKFVRNAHQEPFVYLDHDDQGRPQNIDREGTSKAIESKVGRANLQKLVLMDVLLGNCDRHLYNVLFDNHDQIQLIDNALAFDYGHIHLGAHPWPTYAEFLRGHTVAPAVHNWIDSLEPIYFSELLRHCGVPAELSKVAMDRLNELKKWSKMARERNRNEKLPHSGRLDEALQLVRMHSLGGPSPDEVRPSLLERTMVIKDR